MKIGGTCILMNATRFHRNKNRLDKDTLKAERKSLNYKDAFTW